MAYTVEVQSKVFKELKKLPAKDRNTLIEAMERLGNDPRPHGARQLVNRHEWRIRVGTYRVLYTIEDDRLVVIVVKVGHRKDVYR